MGSTAGFERRIRETAAHAHECECDRCQFRQREDAWQTARDWALLDEDEQLDFLAAHESDGLAAVLRDLLDRIQDEGVDLVAFRDEVDERWPKQR